MLTKISTRMPCCKKSDPFLPEFLMEDEDIIPLVLDVLDSGKFNSSDGNPNHVDDTDNVSSTETDDNSQNEEMVPSPNIYLSEDSEESVRDDDVQLEYTNLDDLKHSFKVLIHKDVKGLEGPFFQSASPCRFQQQQQPQQQTTTRPQHHYVQPTTHLEDGVLDPIECFSRCDSMNAPLQYQTRDHPDYLAYSRHPYSPVGTNTQTLEQLKVNLDENETSDSSSTISPNSDLSNFESFPPPSDWYPPNFDAYPCSTSFQSDLNMPQPPSSPSKRVSVDDHAMCSHQFQSCGPSYCVNVQHSARTPSPYCRTYSVDGNNNAPQCYMPRQLYPQRKPKRAAGKSKRLWEFVRQLLLCKKYTKYIQWEDKQRGIFKIKRSSKVAELWGAYKENPKMNYEKFSRALRHYYKTKVFIRHEHRLTYQFGPKSKGWRQGEVTSFEPPLFHDKHSAKCSYE